MIEEGGVGSQKIYKIYIYIYKNLRLPKCNVGREMMFDTSSALCNISSV